MPRMARRRTGAIGAGQQHRTPRRAAEIGIGDPLDAQQRRQQNLVAKTAQGGGGALIVGFGSRHQKPHGQASAKKSAPPRTRSSRPAAAPMRSAASTLPVRVVSNASLPSGLRIMPRKRS